MAVQLQLSSCSGLQGTGGCTQGVLPYNHSIGVQNSCADLAHHRVGLIVQQDPRSGRERLCHLLADLRYWIDVDRTTLIGLEIREIELRPNALTGPIARPAPACISHQASSSNLLTYVVDSFTIIRISTRLAPAPTRWFR